MSLPLFYFVSLLVLLTGEVILPITSAGSPYSDTVALRNAYSSAMRNSVDISPTHFPLFSQKCLGQHSILPHQELFAEPLVGPGNTL